MTEDAILRDLLLDAAAAEFAAELNDTTSVDVSPRLRRQMTAMLNDPIGWAKRRRRPVWKRAAHAAAVILLTLALSLGALMAASPSIRAAVVNWARETYEHSVVYSFFTRTDAQLPDYAPTWIPKGFVLEEKSEFDGWILCTYHDVDSDEWFSLDYCYVSDKMRLQIGGYDDESAPVPEPCLVNGMEADYYPTDNSGTNDLIWVDEKCGIVFAINSTLEKDVILHIAESVSLSNTLK